MQVPNSPTVLALDIGGTKTLVALVHRGWVLEARAEPTLGNASPTDWIQQAATLSLPWIGRFEIVAAAVTGLVDQGKWSPLNPKTLDFADHFALEQTLAERFVCPATALNDAQAAALGEYRFGAGQNTDMVFLTVSTGVGGGMVLDGRLHRGRNGLAGHFGIATAPADAGQFPMPVEDTLSGRWLAEQAALLGHAGADAKQVFALAQAGEAWATTLVCTSARRLATVCANIQLTLAPHRIVIGGGIGLAEGYIAQVQTYFAQLPAALQPHLVVASLGVYAGAIGAADFAVLHHPWLMSTILTARRQLSWPVEAGYEFDCLCG